LALLGFATLRQLRFERNYVGWVKQK